MITRKDGFNNNTFQKKTFTGVYSNYDRHQPDEYKRGLMETLLCRTYNICSDYIKNLVI